MNLGPRVGMFDFLQGGIRCSTNHILVVAILGKTRGYGRNTAVLKIRTCFQGIKQP